MGVFNLVLMVVCGLWLLVYLDRHTNKAFLSILGLSHSARLAGMPLLVFLQKEERRRFTMAFLRFRRRELGE
jgi:hypothetical protein